MGDWSDAMEDGAICKGCALPLGNVSQDGYCPSCKPPKTDRDTGADTAADRARAWKANNAQ